MTTVVLAGTFDTKGGEFQFAAEKIRSLYSNVTVLLIDVGTRSTPENLIHGDIDASQVIAAAGEQPEALKSLPKADAIALMAKGLTCILYDMYGKGRLHGVMGMGGGCGTTLLSAAFQRLPVGLPKLIISTIVACGFARPFFGAADVTIMQAVTDFIGKVNPLNKQIISNAAVAISSMAVDYAQHSQKYSIPTPQSPGNKERKPLVVSNMLGTTQACVLPAEQLLSKLGYDVVIFHAVGPGGEAMENLIGTGVVDAVLDITTFELLEVVLIDGALTAGPNRLETAGRLGIPQVVSLGGLDMLPINPKLVSLEQYRSRAIYWNNANFPTVRTSKEECTKLGTTIATKLNASKGPVTLLIPRKGLSEFSVAGSVFHDPEADECLFQAIRTNVDPKVVQVIERDEHISDPEFINALVQALDQQLKNKLSANPLKK